MDKENFIKTLMEKTGREENECIIINYILESHNIIGRKNKEKIKKDFIEKLKISDEEAEKLYEICSETIVKGIFRK